MASGTDDDAKAAGKPPIPPQDRIDSATPPDEAAIKSTDTPVRENMPDATQVMAEGLNFLAGKGDKAP